MNFLRKIFLLILLMSIFSASNYILCMQEEQEDASKKVLKTLRWALENYKQDPDPIIFWSDGLWSGGFRNASNGSCERQQEKENPEKLQYHLFTTNTGLKKIFIFKLIIIGSNDLYKPMVIKSIGEWDINDPYVSENFEFTQ
ncbi:MAG: hypothetical protein WC436_05275 [Candidatus Babeliales bacterium]